MVLYGWGKSNIEMISYVLNIKDNRWLLVVPLAVLIWHSLYVFYALDPQYLFFICYPANLILIIGVAIGNRYLIGVGFGWVLVAFPLWLCSLYFDPDFEISCTLFHIVGLLFGLMAARQYPLPKHLWVGAVSLGFIMQLLARTFTASNLNINAAFRVYQGWETIFHDYNFYIVTSALLFSLYFYLLPIVTNRIFHKVKA